MSVTAPHFGIPGSQVAGTEMTSNAEAKRASISEASRHMAEDRAKAALDERDEKSVLKV